jgi:hypothetical protein
MTLDNLQTTRFVHTGQLSMDQRPAFGHDSGDDAVDAEARLLEVPAGNLVATRVVK